MRTMSLAVKYRPTKFEDVVEQNNTVKILKRQVQKHKFQQGYLFAGNSGCGKTTIARIFSNLINNGKGEPIELDCASHNSVEDVREILKNSIERSIDGEYKIFILDECHMFSTAAWNAFLKGVEEPSEYTIYIFCTTEPSKVPANVQNRLQKYQFSKITAKSIENRLKFICKSEGFTNYEESCEYIAKYSNGGMRDAISYLEHCSNYSSDLSLENVKEVLGDISFEVMSKLTYYITRHSESEIITLIEHIDYQGQNLKVFLDQYLSFTLDIVKYMLFKNINMTNIPSYFETIQDEKLNIQNVIHVGRSFDEAIKIFNTISESVLEIKANIAYDLSYKNTILVSLLKISRSLEV